MLQTIFPVPMHLAEVFHSMKDIFRHRLSRSWDQNEIELMDTWEGTNGNKTKRVVAENFRPTLETFSAVVNSEETRAEIREALANPLANHPLLSKLFDFLDEVFITLIPPGPGVPRGKNPVMQQETDNAKCSLMATFRNSLWKLISMLREEIEKNGDTKPDTKSPTARKAETHIGIRLDEGILNKEISSFLGFREVDWKREDPRPTGTLRQVLGF